MLSHGKMPLVFVLVAFGCGGGSDTDSNGLDAVEGKDEGAADSDQHTLDISEAVESLDVAGLDASGLEADSGGSSTDPCQPCGSGKDCGKGYLCTSVGDKKHCLKQCYDDGDCLSGYVCYQASSEGLQCIPLSFDCVPCASEGCDGDQCCNLVSGSCDDCLEPCDLCTYDFQCAGGYRCHKASGSPTGNCVADCSYTGTCEAGFDCEDNGKGVLVCKPVDATICSGCPSETPYKLPDGTCVECLDSTHCDFPELCIIETHSCELIGDCMPNVLCDDGLCHECCGDSDCADAIGCGATGKCIDYQCEGFVDKCCGTCAPPYPVCADVGGSWQCVTCVKDTDCSGGCTCNGQTFHCEDPATGQVCGGGPNCTAMCSTVADCPSGSGEQVLECHPEGFCYDSGGRCDGGTTACCFGWQHCFDILGLTFLIGDVATQPEGDVSLGYCTCSSDDDCLGPDPCNDMNLLCVLPMISELFCPGGQLMDGIPKKMCFDPASLLNNRDHRGELP